MRQHPKFTSEPCDDNDGVNYGAYIYMRVIKFMILVLFMTLTTVGFVFALSISDVYDQVVTSC